MPVAVDGERMELVALLERVAEIGCRHGVGIVDHIEDRIVGLKVRDIYEVPAAAIILLAHAELDKLVGTIHQNQFKPSLERQWAYLVYAGLWWEPLRSDIDAFMEKVNEQVTGTIGVKLYKGSARVVTRESPNAVYDQALASFGESGGLFSQQASPGFIELWSLQSRMAYRLREDLNPTGAGPAEERRVVARITGSLSSHGIQDSRIRGLAGCALVRTASRGADAPVAPGGDGGVRRERGRDRGGGHRDQAARLRPTARAADARLKAICARSGNALA